MSDTQWISVNERLPETVRSALVLMENEAQRVGFCHNGKWFLKSPRGFPVEPPFPVTHWMNLPEPPKPADPFEAWWFSLTKSERYNQSPNDSAKMAWNAAKEHYERPLPDFEAWRKANGDSKAYVTVGVYTILSDVAQSIWSAAQGKQGG